MTPRSFTAFKEQLKLHAEKDDATVRIANFVRPWHSCRAPLEAVTFSGFQFGIRANGTLGGPMISVHVSWPRAVFARCIDNGIALLASLPTNIWEFTGEETVDTGMRIEVGEPWMLVTIPSA